MYLEHVRVWFQIIQDVFESWPVEKPLVVEFIIWYAGNKTTHKVGNRVLTYKPYKWPYKWITGIEPALLTELTTYLI